MKAPHRRTIWNRSRSAAPDTRTTVHRSQSSVCAPSSDDDSLILGIRGTLSASELSVLRARMESGHRNKALRGALYWRVGAGFVREGDTIRKDPDQRVQASIAAVFSAFREVVRLFLEMATPAGAEAAVRAATDVAGRAEAELRRWEQALEHCRYQAGLAERRYRQVDPDNRLIAATLEREWEAALVALQEAEQALAAARAEQPPPPAPEVFAELGSSLERVWDGPTMSNSDRKRLLGCLVEQVTIEHHTEAGEFAVTVHWWGGRVDDLVFAKTVTIPQPKRTDESTLDLIRNLSAHYNDRTVASILNKQGRRTAHGLPFTRELVYDLRHRHDIPAYVAPDERGDGVPLSVADAARELAVNEATL